MDCNHIPKVVTWGIDRKRNCKSIVTLYGCTKCDITWKKLPKFEDKEPEHFHTEYVEGCFACKVKTLELNPGDASRVNSMPQKKWDKELADYRSARKQGIQPAGTTRKHIDEAIAASDRSGMAFNADTMGSAKTMTAEKAEVMKFLDNVK